MASLIEQLQQEALDPSTSIPDLLRKTKVVAVKLDRMDAAAWVEHELNGFPNQADVPTYRTVTGEMRWLNPVRGWCPLLVPDNDARRLLSTQQVRQAISELEAMLKPNAEGELYVAFHPKLVQDIQKLIGFEIGGAGLWFGKSCVVRILDAVRTRVLDWAVELERAGVRGEGTLSFSKRDREAAAHVTYNIHVGGSVTGNVGGVSGNAVVSATHVGPETVQTLSRLADEIQRSAPQMGLSEAARSQLERDAIVLKEEVLRPVPDAAKIGGVLGSIKNIAENAAGGLMASGVLYVLARPEVAALIQRVIP